jgi:hypothetical protein
MEGDTATLSVCCLTRGPTARVAAQLELVRALADEIVVALDTAVDENLAGPLEDVADVLVRYPWADPVDRPVGWVHSLCTRDWILWLDDDEIPSAELLREIPKVLAAGNVTHGFLPRRTLWRDARTQLAEPPWTTDYQLRLVQNDPRLLWFPGITHWPIEAVGPRRYLAGTLYHTDLLLNPEGRRREKVRRYEEAVPGRRVAGLPMNVAYFLPESRREVRTAPVPEEDVDTLERILALEPWPDPAPPRQEIMLASREEIDAHWRGAPLDDAAYSATLTLVDPLEPFAEGEKRDITVRVENRGTHLWPWGELGSPRIRVSYRWLTPAGEVVVGDGLRTQLPHAVPPGESCLVPVDVIAPSEAGSLVLALDLVHEYTRWFGCTLALPVEVRRAPRVAVLAGDEAAAAEAAALLTELAPRLVPVVLADDAGRVTARHGYEAAPDGRSYLLGDAPRNRLAARARLLQRAAALESDALLVRAGRRPRFASDGVSLLEALAGTDALLVLDGVAGTRREEWQRRAVALASRLLGRRVHVVAEQSELERAIGELREKLS